MRTVFQYQSDDNFLFKQQLLIWANQYREVVFMDSNQVPQNYSSYDCVLAVDAFTAIKTDYFNAFEELNTYQKITRDWIFGYLTYDLKNGIEDLKSNNFDGLEFPDLYFFQPKKIFLLKNNQWKVEYLGMCEDEWEEDLYEILKTSVEFNPGENHLEIQQRISRESYLQKVLKMKEYIQRGNIYEANFCMEFFTENASIDPTQIFIELNSISKPPFSVFLKIAHHYLLSASPERFLRKQGEVIISEPIKGTSPRFQNREEDEKSKSDLQQNEKERSENIMIVDLVRNDLSKTAQKNSVKVEELCGIYSFPQVHQMISTITSKIKEDCSPVEVIQNAFPMGSMTGAPKISAMQIIEELEESKRGLYSGSIGYFTPGNDFDFNVVIRSILYNKLQKYVSFSVGSAITSRSEPILEYEECLLKAKAMRQVLTQ